MPVALLLLLATAALFRLPLLDDEVFTSLPVREYRAALLARAFYLESGGSTDDWRTALAVANRDREGHLEPPIMEWTVAQLHRALGQEALWVPRLLGTLAWLGGAVFLFLFARRLTSALPALVAVSYYLFLPMAVRMSVSFQPDAWMLCAFLAALWLLLRHHESGSGRDLVLAAACSALALLIKPVVVFMLGAAFVSLALARRESWRALLGRSALTWGSITLAPAAAYYLYGIFGAGFLGDQAGMSFVPGLWNDLQFWRDWLFVAVEVLGTGSLALALLGIPLVEGRTAGALLTGLGAGFLLFGLTFTYHIHTHGYYHLQALPLVGILLGLPVAKLLGWIEARPGSALRWLPVAAAMALLLAVSVQGVQRSRASARVEPLDVARQIGELVHHSDRVVYLAYGYGNELAYEAELFGSYWPRPDAVAAGAEPANFEDDPRLARLGFVPEYFVVTDLGEYRSHHDDLRRYLETHCRLVSDDPRYLVYATPPAVDDP